MKLWLPGMQCWFRQSELGQAGPLPWWGFPPPDLSWFPEQQEQGTWAALLLCALCRARPLLRDLI